MTNNQDVFIKSTYFSVINDFKKFFTAFLSFILVSVILLNSNVKIEECLTNGKTSRSNCLQFCVYVHKDEPLNNH